MICSAPRRFFLTLGAESPLRHLESAEAQAVVARLLDPAGIPRKLSSKSTRKHWKSIEMH